MHDFFNSVPYTLFLMAFTFCFGFVVGRDCEKAKTSRYYDVAPNELFVKLIRESDQKFIGLELVHEGDFYLRARFNGECVDDALHNAIDSLSDVLSKTEKAYRIESGLPFKKI